MMDNFHIDRIAELKLYQRNGKPCYFDVVSKQLRIKTPEETVRQKFIIFLHDHLQVPFEAMEIEVPLSHFQKGTKGRMDLVVYGVSEESRIPVMVIECKAPSVSLTDDVYEQVDNYAETVGVAVVGVTNGAELILDYWNDKEQKYQRIDSMPKYNELCAPHKLKTIDYKPVQYKRPTFETINSDMEYEEALNLAIIGEDTPRKYAPFILNLHDCLMDDSVKCHDICINGYKSVEDLGLRYTRFGNASGGGYPGIYRYFLLKDNFGNFQIVSLGVFGTRGCTYLCVAVDDFNTHHNSLQLAIENNVIFCDNLANIWHDGRMAVGNIGHAKRAEVIQYVAERSEDLVSDNKVFLGSLDNSQPLFINANDVGGFLSRIIEYVLLRDEYRNIVKLSAIHN